MRRRILIGDLHGNYTGLKSLLKKVDYTTEDILICVGDYNDHFPDIGCSTKILVEALLDIQKESPERTHFLLGNHDKWLLEFMQTGANPHIWASQGGKQTLDAYARKGDVRIPNTHIAFYESLIPYYLDDVLVAVHGGIPVYGNDNIMDKIVSSGPLSERDIDELIWERELVFSPWGQDHDAFKHYFDERYLVAGHTAYKGPFQNPQYPKFLMIDTDFRGNGLCAAIISGPDPKSVELVMYNPEEE